MRKIREVLRLKWQLHLGDQFIAESCKLSRSTVWEYIRRAEEAGLSWPLPEDLDDAALEAKLFSGNQAKNQTRPEPDWEYIYSESKKKGVTLLLLWREYIQGKPLGHGYVNFTIRFRKWKKRNKISEVSMRQEYKAGEKCFVDYAGMTIDITDPATGEIKEAQVFVGTLGASNYTFAEASWTQNLEDWLASHRRMLEFFEGSPEIIVPDNLKTGVRRACYFEPDINRSYLEFAEHYGLAVIPTRVRRPKDKAKVEKAVQDVEYSILAPLRDRTFFSLIEANEAIHKLLIAFNQKPFQKLVGSRRSLFEELEKPVLKPLPKDAYVLASWKKAKVHPDYHVEVDKHFYSVPHSYAHEKVDIRLTQNTLEIYCDGKRIASHARKMQVDRHKGRHTTIAEHMPSHHKLRGEWTTERFIEWATKIGEHCQHFIEALIQTRQHPEQSFRSCFGVQRLAKEYGQQRLEAACKRACHFKSFSYQSLTSILAKKLDFEPLAESKHQQATTAEKTQSHQNLRGAEYYAKN
jgi:transposase